MKKFIIAMSLLVTSSYYVEAAGIMHMGYRLGGDGIAYHYAGNWATTKGGYSLIAGGNIALKNHLSVDLVTGYTLDFLQIGADNKTLMQIPFDAVVKYETEVLRIGLGLSATVAAIGTTFEFYPTVAVLPGSLGGVALLEFKLSNTFEKVIGLKTVRIFLNSLGAFQSIQESEFYYGVYF